MPRLENRFPRYRKHRSSGQAVVTFDGHEHYLGRHGSAASRRRYKALVAESELAPTALDQKDLTVVEVIAHAWHRGAKRRNACR